MKPRFLCIHGAASSNRPIIAFVVVQYLLLKRIHVYVNPHSLNLCYSRVNCTSNNCSTLCSLGSDTHSLMHIAAAAAAAAAAAKSLQSCPTL